MNTPLESSDIRAAWDALKLRVLVPAQLSDDVIERIYVHRYMSNIFKEYSLDRTKIREILPLVVADFKDEIVLEIMDRLSQTRNPYVAFGTPLRKWLADICDINQALFGCDIERDRTAERAGYFTESITPYIHRDDEKENRRDCVKGYPAYLSRIGSLPIHAISGKDEFSATQEVLDLITAASVKPTSSDNSEKIIVAGILARQELCERRILVPLPLNSVYLISNGPRGTLHCSSPVPPKGSHSAFLRTVGRFKKQRIRRPK